MLESLFHNLIHLIGDLFYFAPILLIVAPLIFGVLFGALFQTKAFYKVQWYAIALAQVFTCAAYFLIPGWTRFNQGGFTVEEKEMYYEPPMANYGIGAVFSVIVLVVVILSFLLVFSKSFEKRKLLFKGIVVATVVEVGFYLFTYTTLATVYALPVIIAYAVLLLVDMKEKEKLQTRLLLALLAGSMVMSWLMYNNDLYSLFGNSLEEQILFEFFVCLSSCLTYASLFAWKQKFNREKALSQSANDLTATLKLLNEQLSQGTITQEEYDQQKSEILSKI